MAFAHRDPCAAKADSDEPIFSLRAQDKFAPAIILMWCEQVAAAGGPQAKVDEGKRIAEEMEAWQAENPSRVKVPD